MNNQQVVSFPAELPSPKREFPQKPALRRMATTFESPVGCIRKGCKCDITDAGFTIITSPTTHIECPTTTIRDVQAELASPRKFHRFIMQRNIEIGDFDRRVLHKFMLECFESPFDSLVDVRLNNKMKVKVELANGFSERATDLLHCFPRSFWRTLNYKLGVTSFMETCISLASLMRVQSEER